MDEHLGERLSAYVDGALDGAALAAAEAHLAACAECRALRGDLERIRGEARALEDRPPAGDLWSGIAERIAGQPAGVIPLEPRRRRLSFSVPQLAAAAIGIMAISAGSAMLLTRHPAAAPAAPAIAMLPGYVDATLVVRVNAPVNSGVQTYDQAIRDIELTLATRRTRLDTGTVRVLEQSLRTIDAAIVQARTALARDTNNLYLNTHLQNALDRKLDLLRQVATLPTVS